MTHKEKQASFAELVGRDATRAEAARAVGVHARIKRTKLVPVLSVAVPAFCDGQPANCDQAMDAPTSGLAAAGGSSASSDLPVPGAASDHASPNAAFRR